jgi:hypothetical protein
MLILIIGRYKMTVNELIDLLKLEDPNKTLKLDVHTGDSIHKEIGVKTIGISSIKSDSESVWLCYKPDHITNVYSASGYGTYSEESE